MIPLQILTFLPPRGELASRVTTHTLGTGCIGPVRFAFGFLPGAHLARLVMRKCLLFCLLRQSKERKKKSTGNALTCALRLRVMESWLLSDFAFLGVTCPSKPGSQDGRLTAGMAPAPGGEFCMVSCNQAVVIVRS